MAIYEAGVKIAQEHGDLLITHAAILTHFLEKVDAGQRWCHARFTKKNLQQSPLERLRLGLLCSFTECRRNKPAKTIPFKASLKQHLGGSTTLTARQKAIEADKGS